MTQNIRDIVDENTEVVTDLNVFTVGFLRDALADYPDDARVVFPIMVEDIVTNEWADPAAILYDQAQNLVGISIR